MSRILLTGITGQLGWELQRTLDTQKVSTIFGLTLPSWKRNLELTLN